jgi:hypothetical protein
VETQVIKVVVGQVDFSCHEPPQVDDHSPTQLYCLAPLLLEVPELFLVVPSVVRLQVIINTTDVSIFHEEFLIVETLIEWLHTYRGPREHALHLDAKGLSSLTNVADTLGFRFIANYDIRIILPNDFNHFLHQVHLILSKHHMRKGLKLSVFRMVYFV